METVSLGLENVAFRGTKLMNTEFVYGCALYTGADTKMSQNSKMKLNKFSSIEVTMNKYVGFTYSHVRTVSAANKKCSWHLAYAQLFFDILGT